MMIESKVWCDLTGAAEVTAADMIALSHAGVGHVLVRPDQLDELPLPERVHVAVAIRDGADVGRLPAGAVPVVADADMLDAARKVAGSVGLAVQVDDAASLEAARLAVGTVDVLIVSFRDATNIPLELLIAEAQDTSTRVVKAVDTAQEAAIAFGVLESGAHGALFRLERAAQAFDVTEQLRQATVGEIGLVEGEVTRVAAIGMGMRGCIDTCDLFDLDEGMIVGSTSSGGLLVCAEVHYLPYMNLRPFRVNAGAVHSYVWAGVRTEYVTDLAAGAVVSAVSATGRSRPVVVGRIKTERRPLRLIEVDVGGTLINTIVQDDWHVRVLDAAGDPANVSEIAPGHKLLAHVARPGRHVGIAVTETIHEQ